MKWKWNAIDSVWTTFWKFVLIFSILWYHIHVSSLKTSLLSYISQYRNITITGDWLENLQSPVSNCTFFSILLFKYFFKTVNVRVNNVVVGFVSNQPLKISLVRNASKHVGFLNVVKYVVCSDSLEKYLKTNFKCYLRLNWVSTASTVRQWDRYNDSQLQRQVNWRV